MFDGIESGDTSKTAEAGNDSVEKKTIIADKFVEDRGVLSEQIEFQKTVERARSELKEKGITTEQREAFSFISERIYRNVQPRGYPRNFKELWKRFVAPVLTNNGDSGCRNIMPEGSGKEGNRQKDSYFGREDAWRMYLGMPQVNNTFDISAYRPTREKGDVPYYYSIPELEDWMLEIYFRDVEHYESFKDFVDEEQSTEEFAKRFQEDKGTTKLSDNKIITYDHHVMGRFQMERREDEKGHYVSYYDKWDFSPLHFKVKRIGKPLEIYNRIYFNSETKERIK